MNQSLQRLRYLVTESCRYSWQWLKNCAKFPLGRKPFYDERQIFLRRFLLHLAGLRPIQAVTCSLRDHDASTEGAGCQALQVMRAIAFARAFGLRYVHTPFEVMAHADRPMPEWVVAWESFFNLGAGETPCSAEISGLMNLTFYVHDIDLSLGSQKRMESLNRFFETTIPEFRQKYYLNKSPRAAGAFTVAVHIRRGDVTARQNSDMYTSSATILRKVLAVKSILDAQGVPARIRFFSQGAIEDFPELSHLDAEFFLDVDPLWTMQELIEADILVAAKGFFSLCAGVMSAGIKLFEPEPWRSPQVSGLQGWIPCHEDGSFDRDVFERSLALLLKAKRKAGSPISRDAGVRQSSAQLPR